MRLRVGTRASELARTQTGWVIGRLQERHPEIEVQEVLVRTSGDRDQTTPLDAQGGVGLFTKELERALLADQIDVAVHSLKDLPTAQPEELVVAAIPERESPWDAWISERYPGLVDLPAGSLVATGSLRRRAQILHHFPHLDVVGIRGNIDTRLSRYGDVGAAGLILASAGLHRTGRHAAIRATLGPTEMTPAPGQGALGLEVRAADDEVRRRVTALDHAPTRVAVTAERTFLAAVEAGCHFPVGALGQQNGAVLTLLGMLADNDGVRLLRLSVEGSAAEPEAVGERLAEVMRRSGGDAILEAMHEAEDGESS